VRRPLCPYCYRDACPWLKAYQAHVIWLNTASAMPRPGREGCTLHDVKLAPNVRKRLLADLERER